MSKGGKFLSIGCDIECHSKTFSSLTKMKKMGQQKLSGFLSNTFQRILLKMSFFQTLININGIHFKKIPQ